MHLIHDVWSQEYFSSLGIYGSGLFSKWSSVVMQKMQQWYQKLRNV